MSGAVSVKHCTLVIISDNDCEEESLIGKQWKKEQGSRCCTADVCLRQSVNQLYNNQRMTKVVRFPLLAHWPVIRETLSYAFPHLLI